MITHKNLSLFRIEQHQHQQQQEVIPCRLCISMNCCQDDRRRYQCQHHPDFRGMTREQYCTESFCPGYGFYAQECELFFYLERKLQNLCLPECLIHQVDLMNQPQSLAETIRKLQKINGTFFATAYGSRSNREGDGGYWKRSKGTVAVYI